MNDITVHYKGLTKQKQQKNMAKNRLKFGEEVMIFHHPHWTKTMKGILYIKIIIFNLFRNPANDIKYKNVPKDCLPLSEVNYLISV